MSENCYKCGVQPVAASYTSFCEACLWELTEEMVAAAEAATAKLVEAEQDARWLERDYLADVMPRGGKF